MINNFLPVVDLKQFSLKQITICIFLCIQMSAPLWAATVVESRDLEGRINKLMVDGDRVRLEIGDSGYMLVDLEKNTFYNVEPNEERIIDMSSFYSIPIAQIEGAGDRINVHFKKIGKGPKIAGYNTTHYKMMINEFVCADEYLSRQAYVVADMRTLFRAYVHMSGREAAMGVSGDGDPCERVEFEMTEAQYKKLGIPMRTVSRDGHTDHEIMVIKTNTKIDEKFFELPKSYTTLTVENLHKLLE